MNEANIFQILTMLSNPDEPLNINIVFDFKSALFTALLAAGLYFVFEIIKNRVEQSSNFQNDLNKESIKQFCNLNNLILIKENIEELIESIESNKKIANNYTIKKNILYITNKLLKTEQNNDLCSKVSHYCTKRNLLLEKDGLTFMDTFIALDSFYNLFMLNIENIDIDKNDLNNLKRSIGDIVFNQTAMIQTFYMISNLTKIEALSFGLFDLLPIRIRNIFIRKSISRFYSTYAIIPSIEKIKQIYMSNLKERDIQSNYINSINNGDFSNKIALIEDINLYLQLYYNDISETSKNFIIDLCLLEFDKYEKIKKSQ